MKFVTSAMVACLVVFAACQSGGTTTATIKNVDAANFEKEMVAAKEKVILDVRSEREFASDHLENAINMDVDGEAFAEQIKTLDKDKPVFVYCKAGPRSRRASEAMEKEGFKHIYQLEGGITAWKESGKKTVE